MGIPSYYKKLVNSIPQLVSKNHPDSFIHWMWMDFNCLIYHCLHSKKLEDYPINGSFHEKEEWEDKLLDAVSKYTLKVIDKVKPINGVKICVDGVVPMAKMRQQRLRRFKSAWLKEQTGEVSWDSNAITPGTEFMDKLEKKLQILSQKYKYITYSSSNEPGEGEHKIMSDWRSRKYNGNFAVYGLDADLIVLSLLGRELGEMKNSVWLFREEINNGSVEYDALGEEIFEWFSIHTLSDYLSGSFIEEHKSEFIKMYCCIMSILGNDFLPSSLGLKIRDDGHSELIEKLKQQITNGIYILHDNVIQKNALMEFFKSLMITEGGSIYHYVNKKCMIARNLGIETLKKEDGLNIKVGDNNYPLLHIEEETLIDKKNRKIIDNWQLVYGKWFYGFNNTDIMKNKVCHDYLYGIQWIWNYYTGKDKVCFNWYYSYSLPPLWEWLYEYLHNNNLPELQTTNIITASDILPIEQLSLVLPLQSWGLIKNDKYKNLPFYMPQYFPKEFNFETIGKRFFWECEANIPIPGILEIKKCIEMH